MDIRSLLPASLLLTVCTVGLVTIVALMPMHAFVSTWGGTAIGPLLVWKSWKEVLLVALLLVFAIWVARRRDRFRAFWRDRFVALIGLYAGLTIITALAYLEQNGIEATLAGVGMNLRYPLIALIAYGVFRYSDVDYLAWRRIVARFVIAVGTVVAFLGILQVTVIPSDFLTQFGYSNETISPRSIIDDNPDALRAFATLRGPNDFGAYLILPLILAIAAVRSRRWLVGPIAIMIVGIICSGSRSAWIGALVAVLCLAVLRLGRKILRSKKALIGIAVGFVAGLVLFYASLNIPSVRLAVFHSSPGDSSLTEGSTDKHWEATRAGIDRVVTTPTGCGPGCAGPASYYGDAPLISENYYVQIAEEVGMVGMLLWLLIATVVVRRLYAQRHDWLAIALLASFAGIGVIGLWLHVWSDDPLSLTVWALIGMVLGNIMRTESGKSHKNQIS